MGKNTPFLNLYKPGGGSQGTNTPDEVADIDRINKDFDQIDDNAKSVDDALKLIQHSVPSFLVPIGGIVIWAGASGSPPTGFLLCDGHEVSRTTYALLFTTIGDQFGTGDGTTTFNLPNLKGRFPIGQDTSQTEFDSRGETGGAKTVALTQANLPSASGGRLIDDSTFETGGSNAPLVAGSGSRHKYLTQSATAHQNLPPYIALNFLIRAAA